MTFFWLIAWLIMGLPPLHRWNAALVSLCVCVVIDILTMRSRGEL